jgi:hypothetical protein
MALQAGIGRCRYGQPKCYYYSYDNGQVIESNVVAASFDQLDDLDEQSSVLQLCQFSEWIWCNNDSVRLGYANCRLWRQFVGRVSCHYPLDDADKQ